MLILHLVGLLLKKFRKLDTDKLDELLGFDDIWNEVFSVFDNVRI